MIKQLKFFIFVLFCVQANFLYAKNLQLKIVSLTPSVTKQLIVLGLKRNIIGYTSFSFPFPLQP